MIKFSSPIIFHHPIYRGAARPSKHLPKLSVAFSGSHPPNLSFSVTVNQLVRFGLIAVDNDSLEDPVWSHYPF